jgi:hypothetical protein
VAIAAKVKVEEQNIANLRRVGSPFNEPRGPVGHVDVDTESGMVLASPALASEIVRNAEHLGNSALQEV